MLFRNNLILFSRKSVSYKQKKLRLNTGFQFFLHGIYNMSSYQSMSFHFQSVDIWSEYLPVSTILFWDWCFWKFDLQNKRKVTDYIKPASPPFPTPWWKLLSISDFVKLPGKRRGIQLVNSTIIINKLFNKIKGYWN